MKRLNLIQFILLLFALSSALGCVALAMQRVTGQLLYYFVDNQPVGIASNVEGGLDGGAIGLGIISAVCFLCCAWIEIAKFKANK